MYRIDFLLDVGIIVFKYDSDMRWFDCKTKKKAKL